ncbi:hypothetical protein M8C21_015963, partial [Ambrosia artemisiifolia]
MRMLNEPLPLSSPKTTKIPINKTPVFRFDRNQWRKMAEESIRITKFDATPSAQHFTSNIEPKNVPAVFHGCINDWKAFSKWNPATGGLDYLEELAGSSTVEVMLSKSAPVQLPFATFIGYCKDFSLQRKVGHVPCSSEEKLLPESFETEQDNVLVGDAACQIYLAQVPIMNIEKEERVQLGVLIEDIQTPLFLETKTLASINLWMNSAQTRSSTHYDPHHNLLCVVSGSKQVDLWPPSSSPFLYPMHLYGEASNHSAVPIDKPDLSVHPRAEHSKKYSQRVILHAGDALFIPEGFHQVDSESLTVAVNFWWQSEMMSGMLEHMDSYYLRRILKRLTDKEMNQMLCKTSPCVSSKPSHEPSGGNMLHDLEPCALKSLQELVSLVHDHVNAVDLRNAVDSSSGMQKTNPKKIVTSELYHLEDDPVASILWSLEPLNLQKMFLAMVALVLHLVSPVGAEVLTRKFEEMDQLTNEEDRNEFYREFYGVFDDQFAVMEILLNGKESFSC